MDKLWDEAKEKENI